jgi:hypothetical protein
MADRGSNGTRQQIGSAYCGFPTLKNIRVINAIKIRQERLQFCHGNDCFPKLTGVQQSEVTASWDQFSAGSNKETNRH